MKYMLLVYTNAKTWGHPAFLHSEQSAGMTQEQRDELSAQFEALTKEIFGSGEVVYSTPLADPGMARTVRVRDGVVLATDGPFAEAKEQLAGFFILDCASQERAEENAGRWPEAKLCAVELRPLMDFRGQEM
jgi:hypothetical protein